MAEERGGSVGVADDRFQLTKCIFSNFFKDIALIMER